MYICIIEYVAFNFFSASMRFFGAEGNNMYTVYIILLLLMQEQRDHQSSWRRSDKKSKKSNIEICILKSEGLNWRWYRFVITEPKALTVDIILAVVKSSTFLKDAAD